MITRQGTVGRFCRAAAAGLILVAVLGGCGLKSASQHAEEVVATTPQPPPEPAMQVTGDAHLTLFGELPDRARVPFQARAASAMRQHSFSVEGADFDVDVSPDGKWLVFSSTRHSTQPDLYLKTVSGRAVTQITSDPAADVQPCFSPDGKWIAFASHRSGNWDLWLESVEGGQARQITCSPQHEVHPSFAPDGKRLAYCLFNDRADQWELWTLQLDQPGTARMIGVGLFPEWSPTADSIVYQKARERGGRWFSVWRLDLELGEPKFPIELAASAEMALIQPSWNPDGEWITYGTARIAGGSDLPGRGGEPLNRGDIWIMKTDGSSPMQLTDGEGAHFGPVWSTDGSTYFTSLQNGCENIWSVKPLQALMTQVPAASDDNAVKAAPAAASAEPRGAPQGG